ncbi:biotin--protein ligase [Formica exsecta]|uniref:biotin--protein ligase n=1 Tax=Formica exsecta TaxID=72781 RepID=UPI001142DC22|nr:biotin--protein ligase [Formica exsecta]
MLLTIAYMIYTTIRTRRIPIYKKDIHKAFEQFQNNCSIMFYPFGHVVSSCATAEEWAEHTVSSHLCSNKHLAKIQMAIAFDSLIGMYGIYPRQEINISSWLKCKRGTSFFPLYKSEGYQISKKSNDCIYFLIETDLNTYGMESSECCIKIEDYGQIKAWSVNQNLNLLLETDIDRITSFASMFIHGRYYINNCLFIKRIQSVIVKGKPCIYEHYIQFADPPRNRETVIAFSNAAQKATLQQKAIPVDKFPSVFVHPQKDPDIIEEESAREVEIQQKIEQILSFSITPVNTAYMQIASPKKEESPEVYSEKEDNIVIKPPNVLIYTDTIRGGENVKAILSKILDPERYIIYYLTILDVPEKTWIDQVSLVVICGNVLRGTTDRFIEYITRGGKVLALCSNMLRILLPSFRTAEMRDNELVYFSYGKWKHVRMMHDIFCYQASPKRNRFSEDHEDARILLPKVPQSTSVTDDDGNSHLFDVKILGEEETWQTPSILVATLVSSGGKIVFSQIHLEADPAEYEDKEDLFEALKESNAVRLEIISDLLSTHLEMEINRGTEVPIVYTPAYLVSQTENLKTELLENLEDLQTENNTLQMSDLKIQFYTSEEIPETASEDFLPIIMNNKVHPINFSPVHYYEMLQTKKLGQLVIYSDILTSSMDVMQNRMIHGLAVIPRQQTQGRGRINNIWLSPIGCAMFTLQIHIPIKSILGKQIPILQHIVAVAMVSAVRSIPEYKNINLRIKWPNDIYVGKSTKIGGLIVHTRMDGSNYVCNIGAGINLFNSKPTTCINKVISLYNQKYKTNLGKLTYERYLALVFNKLEILLDNVESDNIQLFYDLYYKYWLHKNASVSVVEPNGNYQKATIIDIDDLGFLRVRVCIGGINVNMSVQPDRNRFDLLKGLIIPI